MAVYKCNADGMSFRLKQAQCYWRFIYPTSFSIGWLDMLCDDHLRQQVAPLVHNMVMSSREGSMFDCNACGIHNDRDPVYVRLSVFMPKAEVEKFELVLCEACASTWSGMLSGRAKRLPDRDPVMSSPIEDVIRAWAPLGVLPTDGA